MTNRDKCRAAVIDRRDFMITASGVAATWVVPIPGMAHDSLDGFVPPPPEFETLTVPEGWRVPFAEPEAVAAVEGSAGVDLRVQSAEVWILEPDEGGAPVERIELTRTYNGKVPGPTFRLKPGDKLEFKVINELPPNQPTPPPYNEIDDCHMLMALNFPACFNSTNLHTHGLHVRPRPRGRTSRRASRPTTCTSGFRPRTIRSTTTAGRASAHTASGCRSSTRRVPIGITPISTARSRSRWSTGWRER